MIRFEAHPLGGVARLVLAGSSQDVLCHGGGEVRRRRTSLQTTGVTVDSLLLTRLHS